MKVFIVHAHAEPQSFNAALKDTAVETLASAGHEVLVSDLYAQGWNPVASERDFTSRRDPKYLVYGLEQRHGFDTGTIAEDIRCEIEKVEWCDLMILNAPVYWFSVPAILKGWIDRVFISGRFYGGKRIYDRGGMVGKKATLTLSLGGQEHMFGANGIHGEMELILRPLLQGTLAYCGFDVLPPYVAYHVPYVSHEKRMQMLEAYREHLGNIATLPALRFPSLDDYDEKLRPKA